jgi:sporulation protein YlmC with PRC-barrel domain
MKATTMTKPTLSLAAAMTIAMLAPAVAQTSTSDPAPATPPAASSPTTTAPAAPPAAAPAPGTTTGSTTTTSPLGTATRMLTVDALGDMDLVGADGKEIGAIQGVVENNTDKKQFVLVERGGFLGFGAKEIAIPVENIAVQGEKVTLRSMDVAQLDGMTEFSNEGNTFRDLDDTQQINLTQQ